ncbi:MAG: porin [Planctomycetota bacterium]|nr:MAG: porin [Planctomycetota bacterium]
MRISKWTMALAITGLWSAQNAAAQTISAAAAEYDAYYSQPASPSDQAAPPAPMGEAAAAAPAAEGGSCGCEPGGDDCGCPTCCNSHCGFERCCALDCGDADTVRLFDDICGLECRGIKVYGWIAGGVTANGHNPVDNFNGPMTFNDRTEGQLNQFYGVMEKAVDNEGCGWGFGARVDVLYGTDHRLTMARGLETHRDGTNKWNNDRFYGVALPQAYFDVAYNDTTIRVGHMYTTAGYEVVVAPGNFFYSHTYTHQYGEPFTHTGVMWMQRWNERLSFHACAVTGWDNFTFPPGNTKGSFLGGATITSEDGKGALALVVTSGEEPSVTGFEPRNYFSLVYSRKFLCDRLTYVLQHDNGVQEDGVVSTVGAPVQDAEWYGLSQYFLYQLNCCWSAGMRVEWFRDDDGARVTGLGSGNAVAGQSFPGNFWDVTWGLNWKPNDNLIIRPEVRYDWFDGAGNPYNDGTDTEQFTAAVDVIVQW